MKKAFTLIETVFCISIIILLLSIGIVNIKKIDEYKAKKEFEITATMLLKDLRYAKDQAASSNDIHIVFNKNKNGYYIYSVINCKVKYLKRVNFDKGIYIDSKDSTIPYDRKITFTNAGAIEPCCSITVKDKKNSATITLKPVVFSISYKKDK